jgi:hypothetical protein
MNVELRSSLASSPQSPVTTSSFWSDLTWKFIEKALQQAYDEVLEGHRILEAHSHLSEDRTYRELLDRRSS